MRNTHFIVSQTNAQGALRVTHLKSIIAPMKTGAKIREIRKARKLKLSEVESMAGMTEGNLSRIERSEQWLSEEKLYALADALGVSVAEFFIQPSASESKAKPKPSDPGEDRLIGYYRKLPPTGTNSQDWLLRHAEMMAAAAVANQQKAQTKVTAEVKPHRNKSANISRMQK